MFAKTGAVLNVYPVWPFWTLTITYKV